MRIIKPPIRIHVWGGLGSQLFAIALAAKLKRKYQNRELLILLHTGGVTERQPEITELFPDFNYSFIADFNPTEIQDSDFLGRVQYSPKVSLKRAIKFILVQLGFVASCNNDEELEKTNSWVTDIRGHYSYHSIDPVFLESLFTSLSKHHSNMEFLDENSCAIHYRLGDLLNLSEKNPIDFEDLAREYRRIAEKSDYDKLIVYSDSPQIAFERFSEIVDKKLETPYLDTSEVLYRACSAKFFVGTSSKVSFWIAALRSVLFDLHSSLPRKNLPQYSRMLGVNQDLVESYEVSN